MRDKEGNYLTFKEYMKRWGEGIEGVTPAQKLNSQLIGTTISLIGILLGLVVSALNIKQLWWVAIILFGAFINTYIQWISFRQQIRVFKNIEKELNQRR